MPLWKIVPSAAPDDARWLDHPIWTEIIVRAPSAAMARVMAGQLERDPEKPHLGNESLDSRNAFDDEKLYRVEELSTAQAQQYDGENGPEGIVQTSR